MKAIVSLAVVLAAVVLAPAAGAKGLGAYRLCGPDACATVERGPESVVVLDQNAAEPPPPPGAYYRIQYLTTGAPEHRFMPSRELVGADFRGDGHFSWYSLHGTEVLNRLRTAAARVEPYPPASESGGRDWTPWLVGGALLVLAAAGAKLLLKGVPMKRLAAHFLLVLAAALALASTATAKEVQTAQACGPAGECAAMDKDGVMLLLNSGGSISQPPPTSEYYRLDFVLGEPGTPDHNAFSHLFVPSKGLVAFGDESGAVVWFPVYGHALDTVRTATRDLQPFAAPAAWPTAIDDPILSPAKPSSPAPAGGARWQPWALGAALVLLALAVGAILARRTRVRRPETA